jgi:hypothetical protein
MARICRVLWEHVSRCILGESSDSPAVYVVDDPVSFGLGFGVVVYVLNDPNENMVLECSLHQLVKDIGSDELINISSRKVVGERLA